MVATLVHARQRRVIRRAIKVECQVVRERDFRLVGSGGFDLSPAGMLVVARSPVLTGEPVVVSFRMPKTGWWFDAEATVARVVHGRRPTDKGKCLGIAFEAIDQDVRLLMENALRGTPPPLPARSLRIDYAATIAAFA